MSPGNPFILASKGQRLKSQVTKTLPEWGLYTPVSAGFFQFHSGISHSSFLHSTTQPVNANSFSRFIDSMCRNSETPKLGFLYPFGFLFQLEKPFLEVAPITLATNFLPVTVTFDL